MKRASNCPEIWSLKQLKIKSKQWVYTLIIAFSRNYDFSQHAQLSLTRARAEQRITESAQKYRIGRGMAESAQLESVLIMAKYVFLFKIWLVVGDLGPGRAKIIMIPQSEFRKTQSTYCHFKRL